MRFDQHPIPEGIRLYLTDGPLFDLWEEPQFNLWVRGRIMLVDASHIEYAVIRIRCGPLGIDVSYTPFSLAIDWRLTPWHHKEWRVAKCQRQMWCRVDSKSLTVELDVRSDVQGQEKYLVEIHTPGTKVFTNQGNAIHYQEPFSIVDEHACQ